MNEYEKIKKNDFIYFLIKIDYKKNFLLNMSTIEKQLLKKYKTINPEELVIGEKYILIKQNYKIVGIFQEFYKKEIGVFNYGVINSHMCDISPRGFKIFSVKDIKTNIIIRCFKDIFPCEISMIIADKIWEL